MDQKKSSFLKLKASVFFGLFLLGAPHGHAVTPLQSCQHHLLPSSQDGFHPVARIIQDAVPGEWETTTGMEGQSLSGDLFRNFEVEEHPARVHLDFESDKVQVQVSAPKKEGMQWRLFGKKPKDFILGRIEDSQDREHLIGNNLKGKRLGSFAKYIPSNIFYNQNGASFLSSQSFSIQSPLEVEVLIQHLALLTGATVRRAGVKSNDGSRSYDRRDDRPQGWFIPARTQENRWQQIIYDPSIGEHEVGRRERTQDFYVNQLDDILPEGLDDEISTLIRDNPQLFRISHRPKINSQRLSVLLQLTDPNLSSRASLELAIYPRTKRDPRNVILLIHQSQKLRRQQNRNFWENNSPVSLTKRILLQNGSLVRFNVTADGEMDGFPEVLPSNLGTLLETLRDQGYHPVPW